MAWIVSIFGSLMLVCMLALMRCFKRCPPTSILVVFGKLPNGETMKCLHGGGIFVWPLIQSYEYLSLEEMDVEVEQAEIRTSAGERVRIWLQGVVAISTDPALMRIAGERLLGSQRVQMCMAASDITMGVAKEMLAETRVDAINERPDLFHGTLIARVDQELNKIGLTLLELKVPRVEVIRTPFVTEVRE